MPSLREILGDLQGRLTKYKGRRLNEENTKATLIDPVLRALGWDLEDLEVVQREYKVKKRDKPVDYALFADREPVLFIEAKALGHDLNDRRWANQIMGYASVAGVPWIVLTDGDEYRIYNAHATVPVDKKLFRSVSIQSNPDEATETLALLDKPRMLESDLEHLWQSHFTDQEVRAVIEELFGTGVPDPSLVNIVRKRVKGLAMKDVKASLARLRVELDFPAETVAARPVRPETVTKKVGRARKEPKRAGVQLSDLISAGVIRTPLQLSTKYRGQELSARIEADGAVSFKGRSYESLSAAGGEARRQVLGATKPPATNGWTFWKFKDPDGRRKTIAELREQYKRRAHLKVVG